MPADIPDGVDVLVVGSGIAGLVFALRASERAAVALVTKKERPESNTNYAQGGIAAVFGSDDDLRLHREDTFAAGAGLCHPDAVDILVREGPGRVRDLIRWGAEFSRAGGELSLGREGGHSRRRIVRSADRTGFEVERALLDAVADRPNISVHENVTVADLLRDGEGRCAGALLRESNGAEERIVAAGSVMLATGGAGRIYRYTTNPGIATGSGLGLAFRAGAHLANLEFVQFHPTMLHDPGNRSFLISEAVRGEGAVLVDRAGEPLMSDRGGSLSTRDVVARAIHAALESSGDDCVYLDCTPVGEQRIRERFPHILEVTGERGWDMLKEPIPVVPGAHYFCGGVLTDAHGATTVPGLFAAGEVAFTGVHGANRLASNSLLEAVVFAHRAAERVVASPRETTAVDGPRAASEQAGENVRPPEIQERIRDVMWDRVGIVRSTDGLEDAVEALEAIGADAGFALDGAAPAVLAEIHAVWSAAMLVARSAAWRRESRGLHFRADRPFRDNERFLRPSIIHRSETGHS